MVRFAAALAVVVAVSLSFTQAGGKKEFGIGSPAPQFQNLPGVDGKTHSLADYKKDVLVIAITCNHCPVAGAYEDRVIALAKKYGDKVDFVAINVNNNEEDNLDAMKVRAQKKGYPFAYLYDESQQIGHALHAHVTPEFYVFNKDRKLAYWGGLDDDLTAAKINERYLDGAVSSALNGNAANPATTKAVGCSIQYKKR